MSQTCATTESKLSKRHLMATHSIPIGQEKRTPMPTGVTAAHTLLAFCQSCPIVGWRSSGTYSGASCVLRKLPRQEQIRLRSKSSFCKVMWSGLPSRRFGNPSSSKPGAYFLLGQFVLQKFAIESCSNGRIQRPQPTPFASNSFLE